MHYYATAANIEKHFGRLARIAETAASNLLLRTLCQHFQETVAEARTHQANGRICVHKKCCPFDPVVFNPNGGKCLL